MVNIYEIIKYLCDREGISVATLCSRIDISRSTITELKHGRSKSLSHANMVKISNYFNVSTDVFNEGMFEETFPNQADAEAIVGYHYLLDKESSPKNEQKNKPVAKSDRLSESEKKLLLAFRALNEGGRDMILRAAGVDPDSIGQEDLK